MGTTVIFDHPQIRPPLTDCQKIVTGHYVGNSYPKPNLVQTHPWGLLDKCVKYNKNFIFLFIPSSLELTYRSELSADFRACWLKRHGLV